MKAPRTIRQEHYKSKLTEVVEKDLDARLVVNRYRLMKYLLHKEWSNLMQGINSEALDGFLKDVVYLDRKIREATEPYDQENKKILEQEYLLNNKK